MTTEITALVPMKAHSERVPRKNVKDFNGKPLFYWILESLRDCDAIDKIAVNTDGQEIKNGIQNHFSTVTIIDRPRDLRGDDVSMNKILLFDVTQVESDLYLQTHATNPLLTPDTISNSIEMFRSMEDADSLFSVTPFQNRLWSKDGDPVNHQPGELLRTQDLKPLYEENSNIYIFTRASLETHQNRIGNSPCMFEIDRREAWDIDEPLDFEIAQFLHRKSGAAP